MDHLLPKSLCKRFYNIYHPSDPIAYRIEPLVLKHYSTIAPLKIHKLKEAKKVPYSEMKAKAFAAFGKAASQVKKMGKTDSVDGQANQNGDKKPITAQTEGSQSTIANASQQEATSSVGDNGGFKGLFSKLGGRGGSKEEKLAAELTDYQSVASDEDVTDDITSMTVTLWSRRV
ncbi:DDHD1 [Bugula neritina]|uniref:DDHD1 n=1 Tax=Bugula neritina TaxID=10212 RepID=A0A7J7KCH1_BUGNE|nr:DDHD1 [Bugula neritina]